MEQQLTVNILDGTTLIVSCGADSERGALSDDERLLQTIHVLRKQLADDRLDDRAEFELLGSCLFDRLFTGEAREWVKRWLRDLPAGDVLRVVIQFGLQSGDLAELPWEYLHVPVDLLPSRSGFVAARDELVLSRRIRLVDESSSHPPSPAREQLRIFVGIASPPRELSPRWKAVPPDGPKAELADLSDEAEKLVAKLQESHAEVVVERALTVDRLREVLEGGPEALRPHVVHLVAHGDFTGEFGGLALHSPTEARLAAWTKDADLADCFGHVPTVVFLHACEGARTEQIRGFRGVAMQLVKRGVPAVVAMNFTIRSADASEFARRFYEELAKGVPVDRAVQRGRVHIGRQGVHSTGGFSGRAFGCPVVFVQTPGAVVEAAEVAVVEAAQPVRGGETVVLQCPSCLQRVVPGMTRCVNCKRWLEPCPNAACGRLWSKDDGVCPWCGYEAQATPAAAASAPTEAGRTPPPPTSPTAGGDDDTGTRVRYEGGAAADQLAAALAQVRRGDP